MKERNVPIGLRIQVSVLKHFRRNGGGWGKEEEEHSMSSERDENSPVTVTAGSGEGETKRNNGYYSEGSGTLQNLSLPRRPTVVKTGSIGAPLFIPANFTVNIC